MGPDSPLLVVLLLVLGIGCIAGVILLRLMPLKILAGVIALAIATASGIAIVNVYYGYYQSWGQLLDDLTGSYTHFGAARTGSRNLGPVHHGTVLNLTLPGAESKISRSGFVYLPPQYSEPAFAHTRFPVVELLHGSPGTPDNWIQQINLPAIMDQLVAHRLAGPMIVVMPSFNDGDRYEDCVNAPGAQDDTYIARDVPSDIRAHFRAALSPSEWAIGGYSSGGYCAANLAMRHRSAFGAAGVLDGYFRPVDGPAAQALHDDSIAERQNNPLVAAQQLTPASRPLPSFWISAGTAEPKYEIGAKSFVKALANLQAVDFTIEPGAGHNFYTWRPAIPRMLAWMWTQIAEPSLRVQFPVAGPVKRSSLDVPVLARKTR